MAEEFLPHIDNLHVLKSVASQRVGAYIRDDGSVALFNFPEVAKVHASGGLLFPDSAKAFTSSWGEHPNMIRELEQLTGKNARDLEVYAALFGHRGVSSRVEVQVLEKWRVKPGYDIAMEDISLREIPPVLDDVQDVLLLRTRQMDKPLPMQMLASHAVAGGYLSGISQFKRIAAALRLGPVTMQFDQDELQRLSVADAYEHLLPELVEVRIKGCLLSLSVDDAMQLRSAAALMLAEHNGVSLKQSPLDLSGDQSQLAKLVIFSTAVAAVAASNDAGREALVAELVVVAEGIFETLDELKDASELLGKFFPAISIPFAQVLIHIAPFREAMKDGLVYSKHAVIDLTQRLIDAQRERG